MVFGFTDCLAQARTIIISIAICGNGGFSCDTTIVVTVSRCIAVISRIHFHHHHVELSYQEEVSIHRSESFQEGALNLGLPTIHDL